MNTSLDHFCHMKTSTPLRVTENANCYLIGMPKELQVRILSFLRADCLSKVQQTCTWFNSADLVHSIVIHVAECVYPPDMTSGFEKQPIGTSSSSTTSNKFGKKKCPPEKKEFISGQNLYTFEHLRNMELLVIARVLSSPEPSAGFVVSKSWCKTALKWLEEQQETRRHSSLNSDNDKKKSKSLKKAQRSQQRKVHEAIAPSPNVNYDITCPHNQLKHLSSNKSARSRRRLLDKKAWKILKTLYPESTPLESVYGECMHCRLEAETSRAKAANQKENEMIRRKLPLSNPDLNRFYSRTRGVPEHCVRMLNNDERSVVSDQSHDMDGTFNNKETSTSIEKSQSCIGQEYTRTTSYCPLKDGSYYVLPRLWCHGWRRYMKTGENSQVSTYNVSHNSTVNQRNSCAYSPPDAAVLLCDAHNMALLPPHLESYLYDDIRPIQDVVKSSPEKAQSFGITTDANYVDSAASTTGLEMPFSAASILPNVTVGQNAMDDSFIAMRSAGLSVFEVHLQMSAMQALEETNGRPTDQDYHSKVEEELKGSKVCSGTVSYSNIDLLSPRPSRARVGNSSNSELLDRENHAVVEILSREEYRALEQCWPGTTLFALRFTVSTTLNSHLHSPITTVHFNTPVCRKCDASGRQCSVVIKNRARNWVRKSSDRARAPASLEY